MKIDTNKLSGPASSFNALLGGDNDRNKIVYLKADRLVPYENQPFHPYSDDALLELAEDIEINGIMSPPIVRPIGNDKYQILAGHNRISAAKYLDMQEIPCIIKDVDDNTATLIMTNTNLMQRQKLLPSEKAYAYKAQIDALKNKGASDSGAETAARNNESRTNIFRYIKLTQLNKKLLDMVDMDLLPFRSGVNISFLSTEEQDFLINFMNQHNINTITVDKSEKLKKSAGNINDEVLNSILIKKKQKQENIKLQWDKSEWEPFSKFFSADATDDDIKNIIYNALESYYK